MTGYSLSAQVEAVTRFAELRGYTIAGTYSDPGRSGKNAQRPDFQRMIADGKAGAFDVIIVHKLDRFSRSLKDVVTFLAELEKSRVGLVSATEAFDYTTPSGRLMLSMLAALAEWYVQNLATEVRKGKAERARQGSWNGTLSYGYTTPRTLGKRLIALGEQYKSGALAADEYARQTATIEDTLEKYEQYAETAAIIDPDSAPAVVLAYSLYSSGRYSDRQIADALNDQGFRISSRTQNNLFGKETVSDLLRNPFYTGMTSYASGVSGSTARRKVAQLIPGAHEPILSKALYEKVQEVRSERNRRTSPRPSGDVRRVYPLTGLMICAECGTSWGGSAKLNKRFYRQKIGKRICDEPLSVVAETIEKQVGMFLKGLKLPDDWRSRIMAQLAEVDTDADNRAKEREQLEARLKRLATVFAYGDISQEEYESERAMIPQRIASIDAVLSAGAMREYEQFARIAVNVGTLWLQSSMEDRHVLARHLFKRIYIMDNAITAVEPTPIMWVLLTKGILVRGEKGTNPHRDTALVSPDTPYETIKAMVS